MPARKTKKQRSDLPAHPAKSTAGRRISRLAASVLAATAAAGSNSSSNAAPLDAAPPPITQPAAPPSLIHLRAYQRPVFEDKTTKVCLLEWSRQIGKSHTLANWAADRALQQLARMERGELNGKTDWLVVVISNSKANGAEFGVKCAAVADLMRRAEQELSAHGYDEQTAITDPELEGLEIRDCAHRIEIRSGACRARILILAASPRTARGFSGDLILDEFAFHENAKAIWDAAEPIIRANPDFLCRIASTHNGPKTLFNKWCRTKFFPVVSVPLSLAWKLSRHDEKAPLILISLRTRDDKGVPIEITPEQAREEADDQKAYDQNYELQPYAEAGALLTWELINRSQRGPAIEICKDSWTFNALEKMRYSDGSVLDNNKLWVGMDVGRSRDLSTVIVLREAGSLLQCVGLLRMTGNLIIQARELERLIDAMGGRIARVAIDRGGIGQGVLDHLALKYGQHLIMGVHFSETVPVQEVGFVADLKDPHKTTENTVVKEPVTEHMARVLLKRFLDDLIELPADTQLAESLHKPERIVTEAGKVFIAAERTKNEDGTIDHADHFWALALALRAKELGAGAGHFTAQSAGEVRLGGGGLFPSARGEMADWDGTGDGMRDAGFMMRHHPHFTPPLKTAQNPPLAPGGRTFDPQTPLRRAKSPLTGLNKARRFLAALPQKLANKFSAVFTPHFAPSPA